MSRVKTRSDLAAHVLRNLGEPVIKVNVDSAHVDDAIDDALEMFFEYTDQGSNRVYISYTISATDVTNGFLQFPANVDEVSQMIPMDDQSSTNAPFGTYMYEINHKMSEDLFFGGGFALTDLTVWNMYYDSLQRGLGEFDTKSFMWQRVHRKLFPRWKMVVGDKYCFECNQTVGTIEDDGDTPNEMYNNKFVKDMATALVKKTWGSILQKFNGVNIPGGVSLNGEVIMQQATEEITKLEEELKLQHQPPDYFFLI